MNFQKCDPKIVISWASVPLMVGKSCSAQPTGEKKEKKRAQDRSRMLASLHGPAHQPGVRQHVVSDGC